MLVASAVAGAYLAGAIGLHRLHVWRMKRRGGFAALTRLDWDTLLSDLLPEEGPKTASTQRLPDGSAMPQRLLGPPTARRELLEKIVAGAPYEMVEADAAALFSPGEQKWVRTLSFVRHAPERALERLAEAALSTPGELYLREHLFLLHRLNPFNLEVAVFGAKRRLSEGLDRFGELPALYLARALGSSLIGRNAAATDDLARAVYFSGKSPFYVGLVLDTPSLVEARPELVFQCRQSRSALDERGVRLL